MHRAAESKGLAIAELLIRSGAEVNADIEVSTPFIPSQVYRYDKYSITSMYSISHILDELISLFRMSTSHLINVFIGRYDSIAHGSREQLLRNR